MRRFVSLLMFLLFLALASSSVFSQEQSTILSAERIQQIAQELVALQSERERYTKELESLNEASENTLNEREAELKEKIEDLNRKERELNESKQISALLEDLIDDQASYSKNLRKQLFCWQVATGVSASVALGLGIALVIVTK